MPTTARPRRFREPRSRRSTRQDSTGSAPADGASSRASNRRRRPLPRGAPRRCRPRPPTRAPRRPTRDRRAPAWCRPAERTARRRRRDGPRRSPSRAPRAQRRVAVARSRAAVAPPRRPLQRPDRARGPRRAGGGVPRSSPDQATTLASGVVTTTPSARMSSAPRTALNGLPLAARCGCRSRRSPDPPCT